MTHGPAMTRTFLAACLLSASLASAQTIRSTLTGIVTDPNGGVLPGATCAPTCCPV